MPNVFSPEQLSQIINETLPKQAPGATSAVVFGVDQNGAKVVASFKMHNNAWTAQAVAEHEWTGANTVGARVVLSW